MYVVGGRIGPPPPVARPSVRYVTRFTISMDRSVNKVLTDGRIGESNGRWGEGVAMALVCHSVGMDFIRFVFFRQFLVLLWF